MISVPSVFRRHKSQLSRPWKDEEECLYHGAMAGRARTQNHIGESRECREGWNIHREPWDLGHGWGLGGEDAGKAGWSPRGLGLNACPGVCPLTWENGMMNPFLVNILFKEAYTTYSLSGMGWFVPHYFDPGPIPR